MQKMLGMYKNICVHKVQLHYRLSTALSTDPSLVKSHAHFVITSLLNYLILHFVTCHSPFVGPEFIVELLASHDPEPCPTVWARWCKW